jgi:hypothetical protein
MHFTFVLNDPILNILQRVLLLSAQALFTLSPRGCLYESRKFELQRSCRSWHDPINTAEFCRQRAVFIYFSHRALGAKVCGAKEREVRCLQTALFREFVCGGQSSSFA